MSRPLLAAFARAVFPTCHTQLSLEAEKMAKQRLWLDKYAGVVSTGSMQCGGCWGRLKEISWE